MIEYYHIMQSKEPHVMGLETWLPALPLAVCVISFVKLVTMICSVGVIEAECLIAPASVKPQLTSVRGCGHFFKNSIFLLYVYEYFACL